MATVDLPTSARPRMDVAPAAPAVRRRRRPGNTLLLMSLAGLLFFLATYAALRDREVSYQVLYAVEDVRAGTTLAAEQVGRAEVQVDEQVLAGLVPADTAIAGTVAANDLAPGELLSRTDLRAPAAPSALRAMSLPIDPARAVGGALEAGDRVDVISIDGATTSYVATDLEVLAVPGRSHGALTTGGPTSVTVGVDDATALELARAVELAVVHVVRSTGATRAEAGALLDLPVAVPGPTPAPSAVPDGGDR